MYSMSGCHFTMITPVVKDISSTDWDGRNFAASLAECVWFHIEIGEREKQGADLFQVGVCNLNWARTRHPEQEYILNDQSVIFAEKHVLILNELIAENLVQAIGRLIEINGPYSSWQEFGNAMRNFMIWEFEVTEQ
jgi:hypothetical protein